MDPFVSAAIAGLFLGQPSGVAQVCQNEVSGNNYCGNGNLYGKSFWTEMLQDGGASISVQRDVATMFVSFLTGVVFGSLFTAFIMSYRRPAVRAASDENHEAVKEAEVKEQEETKEEVKEQEEKKNKQEELLPKLENSNMNSVDGADPTLEVTRGPEILPNRWSIRPPRDEEKQRVPSFSGLSISCLQISDPPPRHHRTVPDPDELETSIIEELSSQENELYDDDDLDLLQVFLRDVEPAHLLNLGLPPTHPAQEVPNGTETTESYANNYSTENSINLSPYAMRFWESMEIAENRMDEAGPREREDGNMEMLAESSLDLRAQYQADSSDGNISSARNHHQSRNDSGFGGDDEEGDGMDQIVPTSVIRGPRLSQPLAFYHNGGRINISEIDYLI